MKKTLSISIFLMILSLLLPTLVCCAGIPEESGTVNGNTSSVESLETTEGEKPSEPTEISESDGAVAETKETGAAPESGSLSETSGVEEGVTSTAQSLEESTEELSEDTEHTVTESEEEIALEGEYGASILHANLLANGVQSYYTDPGRMGYRINNLNMSLDYCLDVTSRLFIMKLATKEDIKL